MSQPPRPTAGFHHVAIRSHAFDRSVRFYTQALGFVEKLRWGETPKRAIMLDTGAGDYLEIFERSPAPEDNSGSSAATDDAATSGGEPAILHFALRTSDTDAAVERARAGGAEVTVEPKDLTVQSSPQPTSVRLAFCKGPDGEIIEFFQNDTT